MIRILDVASLRNKTWKMECWNVGRTRGMECYKLWPREVCSALHGPRVAACILENRTAPSAAPSVFVMTSVSWEFLVGR